MTVVGVTGTKGKSSVTEMVGRIFEADGKKTAIISTIHFSIAGKVERNLLKMTIPGRFLLQKLLRDAVDAGCTHAVIEMSSEGAVQFRQRFVSMDALVFTHLTPEHIESHGSLEKYIDAKLEIGRTLARSEKRPRIIVARKDDPVTPRFFALPVDLRLPFSLSDGDPITLSPTGTEFFFKGERIHSTLLGSFNIENMLAACTCADALGISLTAIQKGLGGLERVPGRMEEVNSGQPFRVFVDYAHTKESLEAVYGATESPRICVLGNTGGGRDRWKRPLMAHTAEQACAHVILTNEDPYDEDPMNIILGMKQGMTQKTPEIILDRKEAMRAAFIRAKDTPGSTVLITGKGTDPYIMESGGRKTPWDDRDVARAVLSEMGYAKR
jgi:UDP-N-acetylmuramoyl-L-alanyl-D-glutamate--2,6-diaminopimelate ligase